MQKSALQNLIDIVSTPNAQAHKLLHDEESDGDEEGEIEQDDQDDDSDMSDSDASD
jgi:hypothetical protein